MGNYGHEMMETYAFDEVELDPIGIIGRNLYENLRALVYAKLRSSKLNEEVSVYSSMMNSLGKEYGTFNVEAYNKDTSVNLSGTGELEEVIEEASLKFASIGGDLSDVDYRVCLFEEDEGKDFDPAKDINVEVPSYMLYGITWC